MHIFPRAQLSLIPAKAADFDAFELAKFIDKQFYKLTGIKKDPNNSLIRSVRSCRLDLRRWGARFESNSQRPYFEGHERQDVVQDRTKFLQHFLSRQDLYYLISEGSQPQWQLPTIETPTILICMLRRTRKKLFQVFFTVYSLLVHDESTFRSGEVSAKRWLYEDPTPFYSKGRGESIMLSDFMVMHQSGSFFQLSPAEYDKALEKYPELDEEQYIDYIEGSAGASLHVGSDAYFDNSTILIQFERF